MEKVSDIAWSVEASLAIDQYGKITEQTEY